MASGSPLGPEARLDTVGIAFDVSPDFERKGATITTLSAGTDQEKEVVRHKLPRGGFLSVMGGRGWVEASLPKRQSEAVFAQFGPPPTNVEGVTVEDAKERLFDMYFEALGFVVPLRGGKEFDEARLVRLDPVRDFDGVAHVGELLDGLAGVPRQALHKVRRFSDAERNRAETITVGPKAWHSTLYDKHVETSGEAPDGRVRYEGRFHKEQLASAWAMKNGCVMRQVVDLTEGKVRAMTRASFHRVGFDREVVGKASVAEKVFGENGLSRRQQAELWAFLTAPGGPARLSRHARARYRNLAGDLGVTMAAARDEAADVVVRLDFDSGMEVCRVA